MTKIFFNQNIISPYRLPLFEELDREYDVTVWFHTPSSEKREWEAELDEYSFNYKVLNGKNIGPLTLNPGFTLRLLDKDFDVYFINENPSTFLQSFSILLVAKLRRKTAVIWSETVDTEKSQELPEDLLNKIPIKLWRGFKEAYRRILFKFSDRFVAFSQMAENYLIRKGVPKGKIETQIQVMPEKLLPEPKGLDRYQNKRMILSLGYLEERKGVQDMIEAFKQIKQEDYRLVIAGTGPYEKKLKEKAAGDDRIEFVGYLSEQDKANYFDAADLFILPTHHDPWGLVVNEAIHYGTPVMTTEAAGAKELLDDENILQAGDVTQIKNKMSKDYSRPRESPDLEEGVKALRETLKIVEGDLE